MIKSINGSYPVLLKDIFEKIRENYDFIGLQNRTYTLARMEKRNSYDDFDANTKYCMEEMKRLGWTEEELKDDYRLHENSERDGFELPWFPFEKDREEENTED